MWLLLGQVIHLILEANANEESIVEQRILVDFLGHQISMKADHIDLIPDTHPPEYTVEDYKITKVFAFQRGPNQSQIAQNNIYRWGYRKKGINCTKGHLEMFLKDHSHLEAKIQGKRYPQQEVETVEVPTWDDAKTEAYLTTRIRLFEHAETCKDHDLPPCTMAERWGNPDCFAVKGIVNGKVSDKASPGASRFETRVQAENWIKERANLKKQYVIEFRKGENRRCERNACWVAPFCSFYNEVLHPEF